MNDWWNDPPDAPEIPECCNDEMHVMLDGTAICLKCGNQVAPDPDPVPEPPDEELPE